ncbi:hypothetical protein [Streptomyces europaeiscabiei]|uniref:hypothetical protein n=1 Tax=Streptomyces europaeiscabiei TaxID=146819 RepID=UPI002E2BDCC2|nr:hypothetical protein [Streptomyces europaeiscabiei]
MSVGSGGQVVRLVRGKGREGIGFSVRREAGHTYVVPQDAPADRQAAPVKRAEHVGSTV